MIDINHYNFEQTNYISKKKNPVRIIDPNLFLVIVDKKVTTGEFTYHLEGNAFTYFQVVYQVENQMFWFKYQEIR